MLKTIRRFRRQDGGMAAVEFALIAPVMIGLFFGTVEVCNALSCHQKVTTVASSAADLVAQATRVSDTDMADIFTAANSIMVPFPQAATSIVLTSIGGDGTVLWSDASNGNGAHAVGDTLPVPDGLFPPGCNTATGCSVILAEVRYNFVPPLAGSTIGDIPMTDTFYAKPRRAVTITRITG
jgi:Flp pilus assembly protein TadG